MTFPSLSMRWWRRLAIAVVVASVLGGLVGPAAADEEPPLEIVVKVEPGVDVAAVVAEHDLEVARALVRSRNLYVATPIEPGLDEGDVKKLAKELGKEPGVEWTELREPAEADDDRFHAWPEGEPTDVSLDPSDWTSQPNLEFLRLDDAHDVTTGAGVVVAVLDTGADLDHPYLAPHLADGPHYDYVDDDPLPYDEANGLDDDGDGWVDESHGHGTHTAGLVALVAPEAEILVFRVLDSDGRGDPYVVAQAIDDAVAAGADVINISFGLDHKPKSKVLKNAFKNAKKQNVTVVAAVGNDGDKRSQYPAEDNYVIGVAAAADNVELAGFSNHGAVALVAAPGEGVVSTLPDGRFGAWSGTSMAAPIVSGQAALVLSINPDLKPKKVIDIIGKSARKLHGERRPEKGMISILDSIEDS